MIRITGGALRGRVLPARVPEGVRPTGSRVREAVFSMLGQELAGLSFLDAFGGSGLMAIEAASRGAYPVTVLERSAGSLACIRANVAALGVPVRIVPGDAARATVEADLVYLDPPFRDPIAPWLARFAPLCRSQLVAEARAPVSWPDVAGFRLDRARVYGDTAVALFERVGALSRGAEHPVVSEDGRVVEDDRRGESVERKPRGLSGIVAGDELAGGRAGEHDR